MGVVQIEYGSGTFGKSVSMPYDAGIIQQTVWKAGRSKLYDVLRMPYDAGIIQQTVWKAGRPKLYDILRMPYDAGITQQTVWKAGRPKLYDLPRMAADAQPLPAVKEPLPDSGCSRLAHIQFRPTLARAHLRRPIRVSARPCSISSSAGGAGWMGLDCGMNDLSSIDRGLSHSA